MLKIRYTWTPDNNYILYRKLLQSAKLMYCFSSVKLSVISMLPIQLINKYHQTSFPGYSAIMMIVDLECMMIFPVIDSPKHHKRIDTTSMSELK